MFCVTAEYSSLEIMPNQLCERVSDEHSVPTHERSLQGLRLKEVETFTNDVMNWICNHICAATIDIPVCLTVCDPLSQNSQNKLVSDSLWFYSKYHRGAINAFLFSSCCTDFETVVYFPAICTVS